MRSACDKKFIFFSDKRAECEKYDLTTTAEVTEDEGEPEKRERKKKSYSDYVTSMCVYVIGMCDISYKMVSS